MSKDETLSVMPSVVVLKLSSGEVLVANMTPDDIPGALSLTNVARLVEVAIPQKKAGKGQKQQADVALYPFLPYTKAVDSLTVGMAQVVFMVEPVEEIAEAHTAHFKAARAASVANKVSTLILEK